MAEIVVIGAGIAGLATATALQQRGHSVTVIEERTDTGSGAGIGIWPNALAALDVLGLGDRVRAAGGRVSGVVRESRTIGQLVNLRPALLSAAVSRATVLMPEVVMMRHLATIAARSAFQLPTRNDAGQ